MTEFLRKNRDSVLIFSLVLFIAACALSLWFLWKNPMLLAAALVLLSIGQLFIIRSKKLVAVFVLAGVGGCIIEAVAILMGSWQYALPTFFNIPLWLMPAWGSAAIIIVSLYKFFGKLKFFQKD